MAPTHEIRERVTQLGGRRSKIVIGSLSLFGLLLTAGLLAPAQPAAAAPARERYVVKTSSEVSATKATVKAERVGGPVENEFSHVMHGFTAKLTPAEAADLRNDPGVEAVVPDVAYQLDDKVHTQTVQNSPTWGLDRIDNRLQPAPDQPALDGKYDYSNTGSGVTVFVVDTGINLTHQEFGGRASSGYDFYDGDSNATDCNGHGTHVAGTIGGATYGVAKDVQLIAVRVLNCNGQGYVSDMISGLDWIYANRPVGPAVVNMSVGFSASSSLNSFVEAAINKLATVKIPVVVAAGNSAQDASLFGPARTPVAITVGADTIYGPDLPNGDQGPLLPYDTRACFSNTGSRVDLYAPGTWIESAYYRSNTDWAILDGTSMASPHVAGAVARLLEADPGATVATITDELLSATTNGALADPAGAPNKLLYLAPVPAPAGQWAGTPTQMSLSVDNRLKRVTVHWQPPASDGGSPITGYRLVRIADPNTCQPSSAVVSLGPSATSYTVGSLRPGGAYAFSVAPVNANGVGAAATSSVRMMALPGKTRIGTASSGTSGKPRTVTARWAKPTSGGPISYYQVKADRQSSSKDKTVTVSGSVTSVKITGLTNKKKYRIYVRALNTAGVGAWSAASNKVTAK